MTNAFAHLHFLRPWWLLALAAAPLLWLALIHRNVDAGAWRGAVDAHLLKHLLAGADDERSPTQLPRWLAVVAWTVACLALAGPAWEQLPQPLFQNRAARVFALELAPSMAAQDVKPSRYERARYKIADLLKQSGDMQTALIAYAGDAFVVAPLTDDANTVANLLDALEPSVMPAAGNDTGRAIDLGVKLIRQAGLDGGELVVLADAAGDNATSAARRARAAGVRVSVLGVGSEQGAPVALPQGGFLKNAAGDIVLPKLDVAALADLAQTGGGGYATVAADAIDIDSVLGPHLQSAQARETQVTTARFRDRGPWLVLLLLPLAALGFRRGWLMALPCALLLHAPSASAFSWTDLWQRADQQAQSQLEAGNPAQAQALAHDSALRGTAAYRAEDFPAAAEDFARRDDADAAYNRGNALARLKQYEQAIRAYDEALQRSPDMADAAANKKAIEDWLKKQQQQKNQSNKNQKNSQDQNGQQDEQQQQDSGGSSGEQQAKQQQGQPDAQDNPQDQGQSGQRDQSKDDANANAEPPKSAEAARQAEQKYREKMDKELAAAGKGAPQPQKRSEQKPIRLGARESGQDEHAQAIEQWLQRVPDDPGGLLRRKFQLEYQMRQHGGKSGDASR
jgi:Ca-activated chloride channel family protein